ncbi:MAG TPA: PAS domain S-box protein [Proteobacteria bacterium]|nr:sensor protein kinase WalK [bacterium BMS3Abin14]HDL53239.1 PAS domain S-box protein [Pseudomonadota bacterium]
MEYPSDLLNLIGEVDLEEILTVFTRAMGVASIITHVDGTPITKPHNFTRLCERYCRTTKEGIKKCKQSDRYGGRESARKREPVIYNCLNAGLIDCAAPVVVDGYHLATVLCGQVLEEPLEDDVARENALSIGISDISGYMLELAQIPIMSRSRLLDIVNLMALITKTVSELVLGKYRLFKSSQEYLNVLINSVSDSIISTDNEHNITMVNNASEHIFQWDTSELAGRSILSLLAGQKSVDTYLDKASNHCQEKSWLGELLAKKSDQTEFPVRLSISAIVDPEKEVNTGYVAVVRDISEEKKVQRMKEELVAMVTHDMRNPVLSVGKALQLLAASDLAFGERQLEILTMAIGTTNHIYGLANDLLDNYRSETGQLSLFKTIFDIRDIVRNSIQQLKFYSDDKGITIRYRVPQEPLKLTGDSVRLTRVFTNLFENAIKYSPEEGIIEVSTIMVSGSDLKSVENSVPSHHKKVLVDGRFYILSEIIDGGVGIPEKYQNSVFDKFFTIETINLPERRSVGIGLAVCQQMVEAHDGCIWVKSPMTQCGPGRNGGCIFSFILPAV